MVSFTQVSLLLLFGALSSFAQDVESEGDFNFLKMGTLKSEIFDPLPHFPLEGAIITDVQAEGHGRCGVTPDQSMKRRRKKKNTEQKRQVIAPVCDYGFDPTLKCENPEIRARYAAALSPDRYGFDVPRPVVRYNLVVFHADDQSDPTATDTQIQLQHAILNDAFSNPRIQFNYTIQRFFQSVLRYRVVLEGPCSRQDVKDNLLDLGCMSSYTGYDGGLGMCTSSTCDPSCKSIFDVVARPQSCPCICVPEYFNCVPAMLNNRFCNPECNFAQYKWDGGDCCPNNTASEDSILRTLTCRDPDHPLRNWVDQYDLYHFLQLDSTSKINVILAPGDNSFPHGLAVMPNDPQRYFSREGGIILNVNRNAFGVNLRAGFTGLTLVHQMGHVLGLLDVHAGTTNLYNQLVFLSNSTQQMLAQYCRHPCREEQPLLSEPGSDTTGDLINDTRPTPENSMCRDPTPCDVNGEPQLCVDCQNRRWLSTPYNNHMSSTTDSCPKDFSTQQMGRMYCYVDLFLRRKYLFSGDASPGPVLYAPEVSDFQGSIKVDWSKIFPFETGTTAPNSTFTWHLQRNPPLPKVLQVVGTTFYLDRAITARVFYTYRVRLVIRGQVSAWSPWSDQIALPRVCNCRPWNMKGVQEVDSIRTHGICK